MKKICVIGVGNPFRCDDGIGIILLNKLIEQKNLFPKKIDFIDGGTGGLNLLHVISRYDIVFFIDAMQLNAEPGSFRLFTLDEIKLFKKTKSFSTHTDQLPQLIEISRQLGELPKQLFIFGIQPKDMSFGSDLTIELKEKINIIFDNLITNIKNIILKNRIL
ncbi:MAG: hydrogenase maturation protease [Candidatus Thermoplasmatota archaeon]|jgi:hydrogenase maturation protease|nr:hydrogenase maturation protease [Candidatus Thermoplasmatota archaeon]